MGCPAGGLLRSRKSLRMVRGRRRPTRWGDWDLGSGRVDGPWCMAGACGSGEGNLQFAVSRGVWSLVVAMSLSLEAREPNHRMPPQGGVGIPRRLVPVRADGVDESSPPCGLARRSRRACAFYTERVSGARDAGVGRQALGLRDGIARGRQEGPGGGGVAVVFGTSWTIGAGSGLGRWQHLRPTASVWPCGGTGGGLSVSGGRAEQRRVSAATGLLAVVTHQDHHWISVQAACRPECPSSCCAPLALLRGGSRVARTAPRQVATLTSGPCHVGACAGRC